MFRGGARAYVERDALSPVTEYGRFKADAEHVVAATCPSAVIVRTSLLIGRRELSVHEIAVRDVIDGVSKMAFFTDEVRCPAFVDDVAGALVALAGRPDVAGALHLAGPDPMSRAELAVRAARHRGWDAEKLRFGTLAESGLQRPARVVLDSSHARELGLAVRGPAGSGDHRRAAAGGPGGRTWHTRSDALVGDGGCTGVGVGRRRRDTRCPAPRPARP